jgi:hypothetical protein
MRCIGMVATFLLGALVLPAQSFAEDDYYYRPDEQPVDSAYSYQDEFPSDQAYLEPNEAEHGTRGNSRSELPASIQPHSEKVIIIDPKLHEWGAYSADGKLIRSGLATAGAKWCRDIEKPCRTKTGTFRIYSLGDEGCYSSKFPLPDGGAPMPYCMFFNGGQAIHGSDNVVYGNVSHGCVRVHQSDAAWLRNHFVESPNRRNEYQGTKVIVKPY